MLKTKKSNKPIFYTYVYLDPRKLGKFTYGNYITFLYEPFYVGKGKEKRYLIHLDEASKTNKNSYKLNKIRKINKLGLEPIIIKVLQNVNNEIASNYEIKLIDEIGRSHLGLGPLTNLTAGGTGGDTLSNNPNKQQILKKLSEAQKGKKFTAEEKAIKYATRIGKTHNEKTKRKIGNKNKIKSLGNKNASGKRSNEFCEEQSKRLFSFYETNEGKKWKHEQSKRLKGKIPWNKGIRDKTDPKITYKCKVNNCKNKTTIRTSEYNKRLEKYGIDICKKGCARKSEIKNSSKLRIF